MSQWYLFTRKEAPHHASIGILPCVPSASARLARRQSRFHFVVLLVMLCQARDAEVQPNTAWCSLEVIAWAALMATTHTFLLDLLRTCSCTLQEHLNAKKKERDALEKDYQASADAKKAFEAAQEREKEAREAVKAAKAAVRQAAKIVVDPPATVRGVFTFPLCYQGGRGLIAWCPEFWRAAIRQDCGRSPCHGAGSSHFPCIIKMEGD